MGSEADGSFPGTRGTRVRPQGQHGARGRRNVRRAVCDPNAGLRTDAKSRSRPLSGPPPWISHPGARSAVKSGAGYAIAYAAATDRAIEPEARRASPVQRGQTDPDPGDGKTSRCRDRKSTRLNSSHLGISYAVFCL